MPVQHVVTRVTLCNASLIVIHTALHFIIMNNNIPTMYSHRVEDMRRKSTLILISQFSFLGKASFHANELNNGQEIKLILMPVTCMQSREEDSQRLEAIHVTHTQSTHAVHV